LQHTKLNQTVVHRFGKWDIIINYYNTRQLLIVILVICKRIPIKFWQIQKCCIHTHVLFGGVRELVLPAAVIGLLDARVGPQAFDGCDEVIVEAVDLLDVHFLHQHGVGLETSSGDTVKGKTTINWLLKRSAGNFLQLMTHIFYP